MIYLLGGRGRLGKALARKLAPEKVRVLDRAVYDDWWQQGAGASIESCLADAPSASTVVVAAGLLDPALSAAELDRVNCELPLQVVDTACSMGHRVLTMGTVMEATQPLGNSYIQSKAKLSSQVLDRVGRGMAVVHARIHTLYGGGPPAPHMFLGQMLEALRERTPFEMTPGRQLREYHHVDDEAAAILALLESRRTGVVAVSHGQACSLRDLALGVFEAFDCMPLLRLGAKPEPVAENFDLRLERLEFLDAVNFRPAVAGVVRYLADQMIEVRGRA